ncbi:45819_t:CDS:2 [Gigaspora margarita]|uniref:45819_t:CDS:1 n=1 Tax=Gigaspora margarita TaxID=4874 RepID=A0ABN7UGV3_GIGMA|nr:45819_t:CDS:2 [Gigaspora margarita]
MVPLYKAQFSKVIKVFHGSVNNLKNYSIEDLIKANLKDKNACYLMIIGKSNSIVKSVNILNQIVGLALSSNSEDVGNEELVAFGEIDSGYIVD